MIEKIGVGISQARTLVINRNGASSANITGTGSLSPGFETEKGLNKTEKRTKTNAETEGFFVN